MAEKVGRNIEESDAMSPNKDGGDNNKESVDVRKAPSKEEIGRIKGTQQGKTKATTVGKTQLKQRAADELLQCSLT